MGRRYANHTVPEGMRSGTGLHAAAGAGADAPPVPGVAVAAAGAGAGVAGLDLRGLCDGSIAWQEHTGLMPSGLH